ncbi:NXPE family member 3 isoform X2, partial [Clarias magur]
MSTILNIQSNSDSAFKPPQILTPLTVNHKYCAQFGQNPTAEEAKEEQNLLRSIAWPGPLVQGLPVELSSDPAKSYFVIQGPAEQHIGGQLVVDVHVQNFLGLPKKHGGDFLIARLHSPELGAGVSGKVYDHQDGNYTVLFPLLWAGVVQVEITMVHPSEAVVVLKRLQKEHPYRGFFKSLFRSGEVSETTFCNLCLPLNQPLCNYTDLETGEPWYCYKPKRLGCDTRVTHYNMGMKQKLITEYEEQFFHSSKNKGPFLAVDSKNNILLSYRSHGPPLNFNTVFTSDLRYVSNELDRIEGGPNIVVLVSVGPHFNSFPVEVFIRRLRHIRRAVARLLNREPATLVMIRTINMRKLSPENSLSNSDWFSVQQNAVLRAMFQGLNVQILDVWEMTLAHHLPHDIHPPPAIIENMIDLILSCICGVEKNKSKRRCCCPRPGVLILCESLGLHVLPRSVPLTTSALSVARNHLCNVDNVLWRYSSLQELSLGYNRLDRFPRGLPPSLESLQLQENRITLITAGDLRNLGNLSRLDLEDNRIRAIQPGALLSLARLRMLSLKGNQLSSLPSHLPGSLIHLDVSANCISTLDLPSLAVLVNLQALKINSNCLRSVPEHAFDGLPRLRSVELANNLWVCECDIMYLYRWLLMDRLRMATDLVCAAPLHLAHKLLLTLSVVAICPRILKTSERSMSVNVSK